MPVNKIMIYVLINLITFKGTVPFMDNHVECAQTWEMVMCICVDVCQYIFMCTFKNSQCILIGCELLFNELQKESVFH